MKAPSYLSETLRETRAFPCMHSTLRLRGMRTVHCVRAVRTALMALEGVQAAEVEVGRAHLAHDAPIPRRAVEQALAPTGYVLEEMLTDARRTLPLAPADYSENQ